MTMVSFRVDEGDAADVRRWAEELGIERSVLLRDALHAHLARLAAEHETASWLRHPLDAGEGSLGEIADWGPADDWSDWDDATR